MIRFLPLKEITDSYGASIPAAIQRVLDSGWYLHGPEVEAFESEFADYVGSSYCIGVGNGLDALTLSLQAMKDYYEWPENSEVILPGFTFIATAEAVIRAGLIPVFADVDDNALLTVETASRVLSNRTKAIVPVHLYGRAVDMPALVSWAKCNDLCVLEDAAQAHGAVIAGRHVGSWGDMAAFSFYPGKNLGALGDAGAVTTDNADLANKVRVLANYGAERKYYHTTLGVNSRLDEIQAAVLRLKLKRLDADNMHRVQVARLYAQYIHNPHVLIPYNGCTDNSVYHIYAVRCNQRERLQSFLHENGIETLIHYPLALSEQQALKHYVSSSHTALPKSLAWAHTELSIPMSPLIKDEEVATVAAAINNFRP